MCKGYLGGICFEGMKELSRVVEVWYCERLWKVIGESLVLVVIDGLGLKGLCSVLEMLVL